MDGAESDGRPPEVSAEDRHHLGRAVELGRRGWGRVSPNPMVGCVLVREGEVVGEGWHEEFGGAHAEVAALAQAGARANGATAYVSLEPCNHQGQTPPCSRALFEAGVERVLFGASDPGAESGGGARTLRGLGVDVVGPLLTEQEAARENPVFFHSRPERPWVALKLALSLDARISRRPGVRTQISGPESGAEVQRLRAGFDALLVGSSTAVADDPVLTVRGEAKPRIPPRRVILDATGRVGASASILSEGEGQVVFLTTSATGGKWRSTVEGKGAVVIEVDRDEQGRISLPQAMRELRGAGIGSVLCEGGGIVGRGLLERGLVDRIYLILAPIFLGPGGVPGFPPEVALPSAVAEPLEDDPVPWEWAEEPRRIGSDLWMVLEPRGR